MSEHSQQIRDNENDIVRLKTQIDRLHNSPEQISSLETSVESIQNSIEELKSVSESLPNTLEKSLGGTLINGIATAKLELENRISNLTQADIKWGEKDYIKYASLVLTLLMLVGGFIVASIQTEKLSQTNASYIKSIKKDLGSLKKSVKKNQKLSRRNQSKVLKVERDLGKLAPTKEEIRKKSIHTFTEDSNFKKIEESINFLLKNSDKTLTLELE